MMPVASSLVLPSVPWSHAPAPLPPRRLTDSELEDKVASLHDRFVQCEAGANNEAAAAHTWTTVARVGGLSMVVGMFAGWASPVAAIGLWAVGSLGLGLGSWKEHAHDAAAEDLRRDMGDCQRHADRLEEELSERKEAQARLELELQQEAEQRRAADASMLGKMAAPRTEGTPCVIVTPEQVTVSGISLPRQR